MTKPNPDNRADNVEKLKKMKENTIENIEAAEESMIESDMPEEQKENIRKKNERRRQSIKGFEEEIADEIEAREKGYRK